jgi:hypothetical protein
VGTDYIGLAQDRVKCRALVKVIISLWVSQHAGKVSIGCTTCGLLSSA